MNIQEIVTILVNSGIDIREANIEVKMLIEHYCNYTALDVIRGVPLNYEKLKIVSEKLNIPIKAIGVAENLANEFESTYDGKEIWVYHRMMPCAFW